MTDPGEIERAAFACCLWFAGRVPKGSYPDEIVQRNPGNLLVLNWLDALPVGAKVLVSNNE